jgi:hypothetical protein
MLDFSAYSGEAITVPHFGAHDAHPLLAIAYVSQLWVAHG